MVSTEGPVHDWEQGGVKHGLGGYQTRAAILTHNRFYPEIKVFVHVKVDRFSVNHGPRY